MWAQRAARALLLAGRYPAAAEILRFYAALAEWQGVVARSATRLEGLEEFFPSLLELVRRIAPPALRQAAESLNVARCRALVAQYWEHGEAPSPLDFFARAALQPYAANACAGAQCPWCSRRPQAAALRPEGEGLARELVCAVCLRRRPFPRLRCPGCGESDAGRLATYATPEFAHLRLEACESCHGYLQAVDLSRDPQAIPEVDELAGLPLDVWASQQGYQKLYPNLAGI